MSFINTSDWKEFIIDKLFKIKRGKRLIEEDRENGSVFYFSASQDNNGLTDKIANPLFIEKDSLIYTTFGDCYYVEGEFTASDEISILKNNNLNKNIGLFIATIINKNKYKYAYGRKAFQNKFVNESIKLPVKKDENNCYLIDQHTKYSDEGYIPDWDYMEEFIERLETRERESQDSIRDALKIKNKNVKVPELNINDWKEFKIDNLFNLYNGRGITQEEIDDNQGTLNVVRSGEENNGILGYINFNYVKEMNYTYSLSPCLTVARTGSAGYVSFQRNGCVVGDSAKILILKKNNILSEYYLFVQAVMSKLRYKYSYGRKVTENKYLNETIRLPIQRDENHKPIIDETKKYSDRGYIPDWNFMKSYINSLPYGDKI